jgi:hypothetical protein
MSILENRRPWKVVALVCICLPFGACNVKDQLLEPQNPGLVDPSAVNSPDAADALRIGALGSLRNVTAGSESLWMYGGLLTDEWKSSDTFLQRNETDQRAIQTNNGNINGAYNGIQQARGFIRDAIEQMDKYLPEAKGNRGELYFALGFIEMQMAEDFCNGIPLALSRNGLIDYSDPGYTPLTNAEVYVRAAAHLDSALTLAGAQTDAHSVAVKQAALIGKGSRIGGSRQIRRGGGSRFNVGGSDVLPVSALLRTDLGRQSDLVLEHEPRPLHGGRQFRRLGSNQKRNSLPLGQGSARARGGPQKKGFDGQTNLFNFNIQRSDPAPLVSGIDARLIEAEAKLSTGDFAGMMTILNALRTTVQTIGSLKTTAMATLPTPPPRMRQQPCTSARKPCGRFRAASASATSDAKFANTAGVKTRCFRPAHFTRTACMEST